MSEEKIEEKKAGPKDISFKSMIVASVWVGVLTLAKAVWAIFSDKAFGLTMSEILITGFAMCAFFSPVYLSIALDKIKDIKIG
jgi:polyferredoxin